MNNGGGLRAPILAIWLEIWGVPWCVVHGRDVPTSVPPSSYIFRECVSLGDEIEVESRSERDKDEQGDVGVAYADG